jgi:hypothetical protein
VKSRISGRYAVACAVILALGIPSVAVGFGEGRTLLLGKRNPSSNATQGLNAETEIIADNGTYGTRQSNKKDGDGGGAIYGCRSNPGAEPCVRANNLKGGRAFEFQTPGREGGQIEVGDVNGVPFTTNAKGTVQNLSADALDGRDSADFDDAKTLEGRAAASFAAAGDLLFAAVRANGNLIRGRGAKSSAGADGVYTVTFDRDVSGCSFTATVSDATPAATSASQPVPAPNDTVTVRTGEPTPEANPFHLQVLC